MVAQVLAKLGTDYGKAVQHVFECRAKKHVIDHGNSIATDGNDAVHISVVCIGITLELIELNNRRGNRYLVRLSI